MAARHSSNHASRSNYDFYQSRIDIIATALRKLMRLSSSKPIGGMCVYADFTALLKGKMVPEKLQHDVGSKTRMR